MVYELKKTSQFKASLKLAKKRGLNVSLLEDVVEKLRAGKSLDEKHHNRFSAKTRMNYVFCGIISIKITV